RSAPRCAGAFVLKLLPALILAYAVMAVVWPWSVVNPLNPIKALGYFSHFFERPWRELFDGNLIFVPDMPRRYVPQLLALKLPEIMLVLGLAGTVGAFIAAGRSTLTVQRRAVLLFLALAATLPAAVAVATRPAMYNGVRHFLFMVPPFAVLAGIAGARLIERIAAWRPAAGMVTAGLLAAASLPPIVGMARLHPYEYTYFNLFAGGVQRAEHRYMLDYWGLSFKQAGEALPAPLQNSDGPSA